jgi:hypothetical protein
LPSQDKKNITLREGLHHDFWIRKLATSEISTTNHLVEFVDLWYLINEMHLVEGTKDDITWKFTNSGEYSASSAYKAQFKGMVNSYMMEAVWKTWAPPKWLILQNQVWMADRLQKRG